jgi:pSer/pThr/pTyr-binding forkhead associated (FHA) protein
MDVKLVIQTGKKAGKVYRLRAAETVLGRKSDCDLVIACADVSRRHCLLTFRDGFLSVEDIGSVNGTYVNGGRIGAKKALRPRDSLEVGQMRFVIEYELTEEALQRLSAQESVVMAEVVSEPKKPAKHKSTEVLPVVPKKPKQIETDEEIEEAEMVMPDDDEDEPLPYAEEPADMSLHLPPSAQLRDILTKMTDPSDKPLRKKSKREEKVED